MSAISKEQIQLVDGLNNLEILNLAFEKAINHVVHRSQAETVREVKASIRMIQHPEVFLDFPLATSLRPSCVNAETEKSLTIFESSFSRLEDKESTLFAIKDLFGQANLNRSLKDDVLLTADELICNALFNAPKSEGKNSDPLRKILSDARSPQMREGRIKIGVYGGFLALSCQDLYGTLKPLNMLDKVHQCLLHGPGEAMNKLDAGTAGIGSFMIFNACTSMFMCVKVGAKSQVCVLFPSTQSAKARALKPKNIHWCLI